jgi:hypothetical protein
MAEQRPQQQESDTIPVSGGRAELSVGRLDTKSTLVQVMDMTPQAAETLKEVARYTHAVPAREETKRERWRYAVIGIVILAALGAMCFRPELAKALATVLVMLMLVFGGPRLIEKWQKRTPAGPGNQG